MANRFTPFNQAERDALYDGLLQETDLDPGEDPSFPARVAAAEALLDELDEADD